MHIYIYINIYKRNINLPFSNDLLRRSLDQYFERFSLVHNLEHLWMDLILKNHI